VTFNETFFDFGDSVEALEDEIADLTEQLDELNADNPMRAQLRSRRSQLATQRKGAVWARDRAFVSEDFPVWDEDVDGVTLGAVRAGAFAGIESDVADAGGEGSSLLLIADGTVDAPYAGDDMTDEQEAAAVGQLHPYYRKWAEARIDELLDPEGNATGSSDSPKET